MKLFHISKTDSHGFLKSDNFDFLMFPQDKIRSNLFKILFVKYDRTFSDYLGIVFYIESLGQMNHEK